jgi:hypothetical protein
MEAKNYHTGPLSYGLTTVIGDLFIGKLRVGVDLFYGNEFFNGIESYLKRNNLKYSVLKINTVRKTGKTYVHFSFALSSYDFNNVKIIVRKYKINELAKEIYLLQIQ